MQGGRAVLQVEADHAFADTPQSYAPQDYLTLVGQWCNPKRLLPRLEAQQSDGVVQPTGLGIVLILHGEVLAASLSPWTRQGLQPLQGQYWVSLLLHRLPIPRGNDQLHGCGGVNIQVQFPGYQGQHRPAGVLIDQVQAYFLAGQQFHFLLTGSYLGAAEGQGNGRGVDWAGERQGQEQRGEGQSKSGCSNEKSSLRPPF
ncbi:MAG: hypothetical protein FJ316_02910 [SAR202 cluster bacterium]|nr:hypothetical protein [SAR202 cluster bacterium]